MLVSGRVHFPMDPIASPTKQISPNKKTANVSGAPSWSISKTSGFFVSKIRRRNRWRNPLKSPVILPNHRVFMGGIYPQNGVYSSFLRPGWDSPNLGISSTSKEPCRTNSAASGALLRGKSTRSTREAGRWTCFIRKFSCKQRLPGKQVKINDQKMSEVCILPKFPEESSEQKKTHVTCCVIVVCFFWLVVSTQLKNISQIGNLPQIGIKIKHIWNHQPVFVVYQNLFKQWILAPFLWSIAVVSSQAEGNRSPLGMRDTWHCPQTIFFLRK